MKRSGSTGREPKHPDILLFERLTEGVADSSTLIRMDHAGFLDRLSAIVRILAIREVLEETGEAFNRAVTRIETPAVEVPANRRTDRLVVRAAVERRLPVLSEDRKILLDADREGIPYFNALMMLNFLLWKRSIAPDEYDALYRGLLEGARYGERILSYSRELHMEILKEL